MKVCPSCGNQNLDQANFCDGCGAPLAGAGLAGPPPPIPGPGESSPPAYKGEASPTPAVKIYSNRAMLKSEVTGEAFILEPGKEAVIGRGDPARGLKPDIMLSDNAALSQGVSRLHAKIVHQAGTYYLVDLNSTNSTYINGNRLVPQQFYSLREGDVIELGKYRLFFNLV